MSTDLVRYDTMCRAIAAAYEVDEVKDLRDKAMALEHYSRQARNTEAERQACEIRLRAERKAGELLSAAEKNLGGRPAEIPSHGTRGFSERLDNEATWSPDLKKAKTLAERGISYSQSSRWQQLAAVPEAQFEAALAAPAKPSTSGILAAASPAKPPSIEPMDEQALWLWGRLRDFERDGLLNRLPSEVLDKMTDAMRADVLRLVPLVSVWLQGLEDDRREAA